MFHLMKDVSLYLQIPESLRPICISILTSFGIRFYILTVHQNERNSVTSDPVCDKEQDFTKKKKSAIYIECVSRSR